MARLYLLPSFNSKSPLGVSVHPHRCRSVLYLKAQHTATLQLLASSTPACHPRRRGTARKGNQTSSAHNTSPPFSHNATPSSRSQTPATRSRYNSLFTHHQPVTAAAKPNPNEVPRVPHRPSSPRAETNPLTLSAPDGPTRYRHELVSARLSWLPILAAWIPAFLTRHKDVYFHKQTDHGSLGTCTRGGGCG